MSYNLNTRDGLDAHIAALAAGRRERGGALARFIRTSIRRWQKRRTIMALEGLSDWMLNDIGLRRSDIPQAVEDLIADDPRPASLARSARAYARRRQPEQD